MTGRGWRRMAWRTLGGGLLVCSSACKPEPAEASGTPEQAVAEASPDAAEPAVEERATLAAGTPAVAEPDALDPQPEPEPAVAEPEPEPEPEPEFVPPEEPKRVLLIGDSLVATGIGALLERKLDAHPHVTCFRKGKSSSGLARPDFFDWPMEAKAHIEWRKPELVIVILGGNDGQDLTRRSNGEGRRVAWDHEDWPSAYRERVDGFLERLTKDDRKVLWLGLPQMGMRSLEKKLTLIRDVQQNAVEALGDQGVYLDTVPFVTTEAGDLLEQAKVGGKSKLQRLRTEDGIHFTMAGSEYFADLVYPRVLEALELPDVQPEP